ncbi:MAG TPA: ATP-dependent RecD-like DNA helicase [Thermomicrobiales bacterium]|nr:ATP-dependent RecD-like DNA helicase [Thermomicrobiales bacterium]
MLATLEGVVDRLTYVNPENGYTVAKIQPAGKQYLVAVVGNLPSVNVGESVELGGRWEMHPQHGRQFVAERCRVVLPATVDGIRRYLGSGLIKGIGPKTAERIVERFGADTLTVIDESADRLGEVPGLGPHRCGLIRNAWREQRAIKEVMVFLADQGIQTGLAVRIYKRYGDAAIAIVKNDPYRLAREVRGIGFKTADKIATQLGIPPDAPERVMGAALHLLWEASDDGHVFLPEDELVTKCVEMIAVPEAAARDAIEQLLTTDSARRETVDDRPVIYLTPYFHAEGGIVRRLEALLRSPADCLAHFKEIDFSRAFAWYTGKRGFALTDAQRAAVKMALTNKVSVLTGGPGVGKTATTQAIVAILRAKRGKPLLAAPTGRAAKRLAELTGAPAQTLHRLLGVRFGGEALHNADNPLEGDLLIVDEASMLDTLLANTLLKAVPNDMHVLFVGDVDQLPSVGAGNVLRDIIASEQAPVTALTQIFRQAQDSGIVTNAHRINKGETPITRGLPDFFFLPEDTPEAIADVVVSLARERLPRRYGFDPRRDIQVLPPMHGGVIGVSSLNAKLQEALNPAGPGKVEKTFGSRLYREGDRIICIHNDYDRQVFNGDGGWIERLDLENQEATIRLDDDRRVTWAFSDLDDLMIAYAVTVHKSQGSEYRAVIIPLHTTHYLMLQRNLLYTAVTRAKELVVITGSWRALAIALKSDRVAQRYTSLAQRLRDDLAPPRDRIRPFPTRRLQAAETPAPGYRA